MTHVPKEGRVLSSEGKVHRIFLWPRKFGGLMLPRSMAHSKVLTILVVGFWISVAKN